MQNKLRLPKDRKQRAYKERRLEMARHLRLLEARKQYETRDEHIDYYGKAIDYCHRGIEHLDKKIHEHRTKSQLQKITVIALVILLIAGISIFGLVGQITGAAIRTEQGYFEELNIVASENLGYRWEPTYYGILTSVKASGKIVGDGSARIYLEDKLMVDSSTLQNASELQPTEGNSTSQNASELQPINSTLQNGSEELPTEQPTQQVRYFNLECRDTCALSESETDYNLVFEVSGATVYLDNITYTIAPIAEAPISKEELAGFEAAGKGKEGPIFGVAQAEWWNSSWPYKQDINLSVTNGGATPTDYQIKISLNASNVGTNFNWTNECVNSNSSRARFLNGSESKELDFWIESCNETSKNMTAWVEVDNNITSSGYSIYMYYGNQNASAKSDGNATFVFFDDFSNDLSKWTRHIVSAQSPMIENGYLLSGNGSTTPSYGHTVLGSNATYNTFQNGIIEGKVYFTTGSIGEVGFRGNRTSNAGYKARMDQRSGQGIGFLNNPYSGWGFLTGCGASGTPVGAGYWTTFSISVNGTRSEITADGQQRNCTATSSTTPGEISLQNHYGSYTRYDDVRVRKYSDVLPTYTFGNESNPNIISVTLNSPQDSYSTADTTITFNCSAMTTTPDAELTNITLYLNNTGWQANETKTVSGTSNTTIFTKEFPPGIYTWNCLAYNNANESAFAAQNRTFIIVENPPAVEIFAPTGTVADVTPLLNVSTRHITNIDSIWYNIDHGANTTLCMGTGVNSLNCSTFLYLKEGNFTVYIYANDTAGLLNDSESSSFTINLNKNYYDSYDDNSSVDGFNGVKWEQGRIGFSSYSGWNESWPYIQRINLSVSSGATPKNYQALIKLNSSDVGANFNWSNECINSNSSRARFVNQNDNLELDYWVESCNETSKNMTAWVEVDNNITSSGYNIYMYYGNQNASAKSDGNATFDFFDFGTSTTGWTVGTGSGVTSSAAGGSPTGLTDAFYSDSGGTGYNMYKNAGLPSPANVVIQYYTYSTGLGNLYFTASSAGVGTMSRLDTRGGANYVGLAKTASWTAWNCPQTSTLLSASTWYTFTVLVNGSQVGDYYKTGSRFDNNFGTAINALSTGYTDGCGGGAQTYSNDGSYIGLVGDGFGVSYTTYWQNIVVRKYSDSVPTYTVGAELANSAGLGAGNFTSYSANLTNNVYSITNITWNESGTDQGNNITVELSVDNGLNWYFVNKSSGLSGFTRNSSLVYRASFSTNATTTIYLEDINITWTEDIADKSIYSITLNEPTTTLYLNTSQAFQMNCTPLTSGANSGIAVSLQYNSSSFVWKDIETTGFVNLTASSNPFMDVQNSTMYNATTVAYTAGLYNVRCRLYNATDSLYSGTQTINISQAVNVAPNIVDISPIPSQTVTEAGISWVQFYVTANDSNGVYDLKDSSINATFASAGETTRVNTSCLWKNDINSYAANYSCTIGLMYWDGPGVWNVSASIMDLAGETSSYYNESFTLEETTAIKITPNAISWAELMPGQQNSLALNSILVNNTGNHNVTLDGVKVTAVNLLGVDVPGYFIPAGNFTAATSNACDVGTVLVNGTATNIAGSSLPRGNNSAGFGTEELFYCLEEVPRDISSQEYSTPLGGSWIISVV